MTTCGQLRILTLNWQNEGSVFLFDPEFAVLKISFWFSGFSQEVAFCLLLAPLCFLVLWVDNAALVEHFHLPLDTWVVSNIIWCCYFLSCCVLSSCLTFHRLLVIWNQGVIRRVDVLVVNLFRSNFEEALELPIIFQWFVCVENWTLPSLMTMTMLMSSIMSKGVVQVVFERDWSVKNQRDVHLRWWYERLWEQQALLQLLLLKC